MKMKCKRWTKRRPDYHHHPHHHHHHHHHHHQVPSKAHTNASLPIQYSDAVKFKNNFDDIYCRDGPINSGTVLLLTDLSILSFNFMGLCLHDNLQISPPRCSQIFIFSEIFSQNVGLTNTLGARNIKPNDRTLNW